MGIKCLFGHHDWKFSYHHGIPLGINWVDYYKMCQEGKTFSVDVCSRCHKQSRVIDGKRVMLTSSQVEEP